MKTWTLRAPALISGVMAAALLAACGSSQSSGTGTTQTSGAVTTGTTTQTADSGAVKHARAGFVTCLREHGATVSVTSTGAIQPAAGTSPEVLRAALGDCGKKYGAAYTASSPAPTPARHEADTKLSECLKQHGVSLGSGKTTLAAIEKDCGSELKDAVAPTTGADITIGKVKIGRIDLRTIKIGKLKIAKIHIGDIHIGSLEQLGTQPSLKTSTTPAN